MAPLDKTCCYCRRPVNVLTRVKFPTFYLCSKCKARMSPYFTLLKTLTPADIAAHMEYRMRNKQALASFRPTLTIANKDFNLLLDENSRRFLLATDRELTHRNPDLMFLDQLSDVKLRSTSVLNIVEDEDGVEDYRYYLLNDYLILSFKGHPFMRNVSIRVWSKKQPEIEHQKFNKKVFEQGFLGLLDANNLEISLRSIRDREIGAEMAYVLRQELAKIRGDSQPEAAAPKAAVPEAAAPKAAVPEATPTTPTQAAAARGWTCIACGGISRGNFCMDCGARRPSFAPLYRCDICGWEPEDPRHPPKFCPECGDRFDEGDIYTMTEEADENGTL